jgi:hypothetical protein
MTCGHDGRPVFLGIRIFVCAVTRGGFMFRFPSGLEGAEVLLVEGCVYDTHTHTHTHTHCSKQDTDIIRITMKTKTKTHPE